MNSAKKLARRKAARICACYFCGFENKPSKSRFPASDRRRLQDRIDLRSRALVVRR